MKWLKQKVDLKGFNLYKSDCGLFTASFTKIGSNVYFSLRNKEDLNFLGLNCNGGTKFGIKETLTKAEVVISKFDFNSKNIGENREAYEECLKFDKEISKN